MSISSPRPGNADGRKITHQRWTIWTAHTVYPTTNDYVSAKLEATAEPRDWTEEDQQSLDSSIADWQKSQDLTPGFCRDFFFQGPPRLDDLFPGVGLEAFSYYRKHHLRPAESGR